MGLEEDRLDKGAQLALPAVVLVEREDHRASREYARHVIRAEEPYVLVIAARIKECLYTHRLVKSEKRCNGLTSDGFMTEILIGVNWSRIIGWSDKRDLVEGKQEWAA